MALLNAYVRDNVSALVLEYVTKGMEYLVTPATCVHKSLFSAGLTRSIVLIPLILDHDRWHITPENQSNSRKVDSSR
jgi:hypothetical protein